MTFSSPYGCASVSAGAAVDLKAALSMSKTGDNYGKAVVKLKKSSENSEQSVRKFRPARSPEARENQMISLAIDLAEKQLVEGTASSQVITHFLKLGSTKEKIEKEILEKQKELIAAKTESLQSAKRMEEMYAEAMSAIRDYRGEHSDEEDD